MITRTILTGWILAVGFWPTHVQAECLSSAKAVWKEHGNVHASWEGRSHPGQRCWFAGYPKGEGNGLASSNSRHRDASPGYRIRSLAALPIARTAHSLAGAVNTNTAASGRTAGTATAESQRQRKVDTFAAAISYDLEWQKLRELMWGLDQPALLDYAARNRITER